MDTNKFMSGLFRLNWKDLVKGVILAVITAILGYFYQALEGGVFDWKQLGIVSATALVAYLIKNLLTDEEGKFFQEV